MSFKNIAIVSVLKPVNDTRSYEKMAKTLAETNMYSPTIIGSDPGYSCLPVTENIHFSVLPKFNRLGIRRLFVPVIVFNKLIKLKPQLVIVNTFELLIVTIVNQILFGGKIVYDLQENYYRNLIYQDNYPPVVKHIFGYLVRLKEILLSPFIDHFILAEKGYQNEIQFIKNKFTLIENKALIGKQNRLPKTSSEKMKFLFSGNLSENSGVLIALSFYKSIRHLFPESGLTIIGHCPSTSFLQKLTSAVSESIELIVDTTPIGHSKILEHILKSDFGIVSYKVNPSNENCMPTKVFEYLAYGLPIISQTGTIWTDCAMKYEACIPVNFEQVEAEKVASQLREFLPSYEPKDIPEVRWKSEEKKLISLIDKLTKE